MTFDLQPILQGELVELRPLREDDFQDLFAVASDPKIWEQHPDSNRYQEEVFKAFFRDAMNSQGALIAVDSADRQVFGSSRFYAYDSAKSVIEVGFTFLARSHWGGSYNREIKRLMLTHAFRYVDAVLFTIGAQNIRSQRAIEKVGGSHLKSRVDEQGREHLVYQITALTSQV